MQSVLWERQREWLQILAWGDKFRIAPSKVTQYVQSFFPMAIQTHNQQAGR